MINFKAIEDTIGYEFDNRDLLQQAFVRRSYSAENGGQNNEVLEFIGDKALDLAVIRLMMDRFGTITDDKAYSEFKLRNPKYFQTKLSEGEFTDIKKDLVEKKALAKCIDSLGFNQYLIMGNGDINNNAQDSESVKEDLFEAIVGAVTIDSNWNLDIITDVVEAMIDFNAYFDNDDEHEDYVGLFQRWYLKEYGDLPDYSYYEAYDGFECSIELEEIGLIKASGSSKAEARAKAAMNAYIWLEDNGYIVSEYEDAVGRPDKEEAIRQLNELAQKRLITKPQYKFERILDEYGDLVWKCTCEVPEAEWKWYDSDTIKREAQRKAAYLVLMDLMEYDDEDEEEWENESSNYDDDYDEDDYYD